MPKEGAAALPGEYMDAMRNKCQEQDIIWLSGSICQPGALITVGESTLQSDLCAGNGQFGAE